MPPRTLAIHVALASLTALGLTTLGCDSTSDADPDPIDGAAADPDAAPDDGVDPVPDDGLTPDVGLDPDAGPAPSGLPEGESRWTGTFELGGAAVDAELDLDNTGGDLTGRVRFDANGLEGEYGVTGTWAPAAAHLALAPADWIVTPPVDLELIGFIGDYADDTLTGRIVDYASGTDNSLLGGPATFTRVEGDGAPTPIGAATAALDTGETVLTGTMQCRGDAREVSLALTHDGEGRVDGTLTFGDLTLAEAPATFEVSGAHNPTNGRTTLTPGIYVSDEYALLTFFVDGTYDPETSTLTGNLRQNVGACPPDLFVVGR